MGDRPAIDIAQVARDLIYQLRIGLRGVSEDLVEAGRISEAYGFGCPGNAITGPLDEVSLCPRLSAAASFLPRRILETAFGVRAAEIPIFASPSRREELVRHG
jgi:hypothetical protein